MNTPGTSRRTPLQAAVETNLSPKVIIRGEPETRWELVERMAHYHVPGVSIAILKDFHVEWAAGYGTLEAGARLPVEPETAFQAASISKPVAAMGALALVQQGLLDLDEPVNQRLTSWKLPDNEFTQAEPVTLRRLLSHSAGLTVGGFPGYAAGETIPSLCQVLDGLPPANTPPIRVDIPVGSQCRYSGGGYTILQQLIEDVTHQSFSSALQSLVLDPLNMTSSIYQHPLDTARFASIARAHQSNGEVVPGKWHTYPELAAAGLWTTPSDLLCFAMEIQRAYLDDAGRVLPQPLAREMLTPQAHASFIDSDAAAGLGLFLTPARAPRYFSHSGGNEGYRCLVTASLDGHFGAAIMTNADNGSYLTGEIFQSIARVYEWPEYGPAIRIRADIDPSTYSQYTGEYFFDDHDHLTVGMEGGRLTLIASGAPAFELVPESQDRFFMVEMAQSVDFTRGETGNVTGLSFMGYRAKRV